MTGSSPSPKGTLLHRLCPQCDLEILEDRTTCATCGSKLVEVRDEIDQVVGTVIDERFEIRAKVGQGGMGTVYRAWQKSIGREVAIKLMDRSYSRDTMAVRRFLREARLASQLSQPNTVSVFDFGQAADGRLFIAMELIRGRTLHEVVNSEGAFSIERCARIGTQICDALEAAHAIGIVHRDLKLENVIVLDHPPGRDLLKVLDFGLAKNIRDPGSRATESGIVVGTPRYMSPDSATTGTIGPAGDLYSLGVILGELATGKPMWTGETLTELIAQKLDPTSALVRVPGPLRPLLTRLLDPEPDSRPTAPHVRELLTAALDADPNASAGDLDPRAASTTNLRSPSSASEPTRQLTPERVALAPTSALVTPPPGASSSSSSSSSSAAGSAAQSVSPSLSELERPRAKRWPVVVVGLGALAAVGTTIAIVIGGKHGDDKPAAHAVAPAADAQPPDATVIDAIEYDAAQLYDLSLTTVPAGASVTVGDVTCKAPCSTSIEPGSFPIDITASLAGYKAATTQIVPDGNKSVTIKLQRAPRPKPRRNDGTPF
jgi:serine/threonine-protein kinase